MEKIKPSFLKNCGLSTLFLIPHSLHAANHLNIYCTLQNDACEEVVQRFSQQYNINTKFVRASTGVTLGKIKAEKDNPQADIWYGGTLEPHLQARDLGLLEKYRSPKQTEVLVQFKDLINKYGDYTSFGYMLVLGLGVNTAKLKQLGFETPKCWHDLRDPRLKGEVQLPDPQSSGTGYAFIATLIQLWGEEKAFDFLKKLNKNISQYVKSGLVTSNLARGDSSVSVGFLHTFEVEKAKGAPLKSIPVCDGDSYTLGGISIIKGARNLDNAKLFMDWALSKEGQELNWIRRAPYQIPTNKYATVLPSAVNPEQLNLMKFDFEKFGSSKEAKRILSRWLEEVKLSQ
ncbi:ABC transporter substrate-binding protein [Pasteurella multocida]|uniref:ABC transporter substrate-binding protein n=1 Tax=Pasteurella multocida TaxID=747 RepID=UPI002B4733BD|nr:ABC transporter substrate-binding protein [Pasteurella multocida]MEB3475990.1 ABC transporter substrate-binding protein [Pasteurella multocida]MEB3507586.1 ABC transporter substrate-binding protein [Pasteurella multocida]WRJ99435.1 ABC transporter substrate-binding protein [Pasteurella multocida]